VSVFEGSGVSPAFIQVNIDTTAADYTVAYENILPVSTSTTGSGCVIAPMTAADTAKVVLDVTGDIDVFGSSAPRTTSFSGRLMP
jgi:hypothetical protein